jgi:lipopolysaccharide export system protein LptA
MPVFVKHLRRWFAAAGITAVLVVGAVYFYGRSRVQNALKQVPAKIGLEIQQSATGFTISKSEQGRTLFRVDASKAVQFKQGGRVELHNVVITVYGRDSDRYDRIYGSDFEYNQQSGDVNARGEVQIDLEANPEGVLNADQAPPQQLKEAVHLRTSGLVFNQKTGDAHTDQKVEFQLPQASGSGVGMNYMAKTTMLTVQSQVKLVGDGPGAPSLDAARAVITKDPHQVVLEHPEFEMIARKGESDKATLFLRPDNTLDRIVASGNVMIQATAPVPAQAHADRLELTLGSQQPTLRTAVFSGAVTADVSGDQPVHANAGRVELAFRGSNLLTKVRAEDNVKLVQQQKSNGNAAPQNLELTTTAIDFVLKEGNRLTAAETSASAQIALLPVTSTSGSQTFISAGKFHAGFDDSGQLVSLHGAPNARIVNNNPDHPDRISTSETLDATLQPGNGIQSIVQQGSVTYVDGERKAWSDRASYTPADQVLTLTGSPRVIESGMATTANSMRLNRATGDAFAEGNVKTTYSDLKAQPGGALLASSSPIHVTAASMFAHGTSAAALYSGNVRLWQDANTVEAPSIEFNRDQRSMTAQGRPEHPVSTVLVQIDKDGKTTPVAITSSRLIYADNLRQAHFTGKVVVKGSDLTITADQLDAFLEPRGQPALGQSSSAGKLDKIIAAGQVVITDSDRRATGNKLVYTTSDDKFVLTGGSPSIFDAEHGKITGVSLTFFRRDDRVLVEGDSKFPTVTQTRVAR